MQLGDPSFECNYSLKLINATWDFFQSIKLSRYETTAFLSISRRLFWTFLCTFLLFYQRANLPYYYHSSPIPIKKHCQYYINSSWPDPDTIVHTEVIVSQKQSFKNEYKRRPGKIKIHLDLRLLSKTDVK